MPPGLDATSKPVYYIDVDNLQDYDADAVCRAARSIGQQYPWADLDTIETVVTLLRMQGRLARNLDEQFRPFGLTAAKFDLLLVLHRAPGQRLTMWEIGRHLRVTRTNVTGLVDGLERDNLVRRLPHPEDRRSLLAELTPAGEDLVHRALPETWRWMDDLLGDFSLDEKHEMLRLLRKVQARLGLFREKGCR